MLCLVIRHAVALVLALKVQLVCIACDRELTAFFRVATLMVVWVVKVSLMVISLPDSR